MSDDTIPKPGDDVRAATMLGTLDIDVLEASGDRVVLRMPVTPKVHQPAGLLHGGASCVLAETATSMGAWFHVGPERQVVGVEINANHIRSIREGTVTAVATPLHQGRTTQIWQTLITDQDDRLICVSRSTIAVLDPQPALG